jgi:hypothetical protein
MGIETTRGDTTAATLTAVTTTLGLAAVAWPFAVWQMDGMNMIYV